MTAPKFQKGDLVLVLNQFVIKKFGRVGQITGIEENPRWTLPRYRGQHGYYLDILPKENAFLGLAVPESELRKIVDDGKEVSSWSTGSWVPKDLTTDRLQRARRILEKYIHGNK